MTSASHRSHEKNNRPSTRRCRLRRWFGWGIGVGVVIFIGLGIALDRYGSVERAQPAQAIVILGAGLIANGQPGDSLTCRTLHAAQLYRQGLAPAVICTGGIGKFPPSEARIAAELAMRHGVPAAAIYGEERSTSTWENVINAAVICRAHGWTRVIAVSDPYHLWRVRHDFALQGIRAYPSPATQCLRHRHFGLRVLWTARETALVIRDLLLGH